MHALTFCLVVLVSTSAHAVPPLEMPYVLHSEPAPVRPLWYGSVRNLDIEGGRVAYAMSESVCYRAFCPFASSIEYFDGIRAETIERSTTMFIEHLELAHLLVWQVPNGSVITNFVRAMDPRGRRWTLTADASYDAFATGGDDVAWQFLDETTFAYDIRFRGHIISAHRDDYDNKQPHVAGGNVFYSGSRRMVFYDGRTQRSRDLPLILPDQQVSGTRIAPDGSSGAWLLRDFSEAPDHNALVVYFASSGRVRRVDLGDESPLFDLGFDGRHYLWVSSTQRGLYAVATDVRTGTSEVIESTLLGGTDAYYQGTFSQGLLSYITADHNVRLYDVANRKVTTVAKSGETRIASSGPNVAWFTGENFGHPILNIAQPANEALRAIEDVMTWNDWHSDDTTDAIDRAMAALEAYDFGSARTELLALVDLMATLDVSADSEALIAATQRIIDVL